MKKIKTIITETKQGYTVTILALPGEQVIATCTDGVLFVAERGAEREAQAFIGNI